jgi:hypothetical protein
MDIYGAFQLCSTSILAVPITAMLSRTYFNVPGRNIIFIWTVLTLAGEFYHFPRVEYFERSNLV